MFEIIFLFVLALIWLIFATIQDVRTTEIANWICFSLIIFALGFRLFYSLFEGNGFGFFYQGVIGLVIFFVLGNVFYSGKMFAGGDAKLFIALGPVLPFSQDFLANVNGFFLFLMIFLICGGIYSLLASTWLCFMNYSAFRKEFKKQFKINKNKASLSLIISIAFILLAYFINFYFLFLGILMFILPYLYLYAKSVDEVAMVKEINSNQLREGDWLYKDVKIKGSVIKATWDGLSRKEIYLLRKHKKKVLIRQGVPFTPVFLISFPVFFYLWNKGLGYPFW